MENKPLRQILMVSKWILYGFVLQCFFGSMLLANKGKAQRSESVKDVVITVNFENDNLIEAFHKIEMKTDFRFAFNKQDLDKNIRLKSHHRNKSLYEILIALSKDADLKFKQINNTINVDRAKKLFKNDNAEVDIYLQTLTVVGKVISGEDKTGLPGVNVVEKGTTNGTVTDIDGNYRIEVSEGATLVFSSIGFINEEVVVGNQSVINMTLTPDITQLAEIVVVGYGEQKKEDLTGAVAVIDNEDFNAGVISSPQELLVGRIAGVSIISNGGAPGSGATIRIRGGSSLRASNDPLIVIDGFPVDNADISGLSNPLSTLNPNDIASFTVLKDASATAIYGSRASNGVIIITTKKGKEGKPQFNFSTQVSVSSPIEFVDVLNGDEYRALIDELRTRGFTGINDAAYQRLGDENTDWQEEIFRNAISHNHNITASGSFKEIPYRVSYGYTGEQGILETTSMKRHSISLNLSPTLLNDNLKININAKEAFAYTDFGDQGAVGSAVNFDPTQPIRNGNDRYAGYFAWTTEDLPGGAMDPEGPANTFISNPVALLALRNNTANVNRFIGNAQIDYKLPFLSGLSANLNVGLDYSSTDGQDDALPGTTWTYRDYTGPQGRLRDYTAENTSKLLDFYLKYEKELDNHRFDIQGGYSWQHFEREDFTFDRDGDESQEPLIDHLKTFNENYIISFFGRLNYSLLNKYLLTATFRSDGSSRFIGDNKWGHFPSVALAWKINEESFLSEADLFTELKLRLGYGITGQQDISDSYYPALAVYTRSVGGASYQFGEDNFVPTLRPEAFDPNIKWEETTTYNIGLDFGILDDKIFGSVEFYKRETKDLINNIPIPGGSNFSNYLITNVGTLENNGYEVTLNVRPVTTPDLTWTVGANLTHNENKITKLNKIDDPNDPGIDVGAIAGGQGNTIQIHSVGYPAYSFFVFQQVYDAEGNPVEGLYVDRSGNGGEVTSSALNKYHLGSPAADFLIGINSRLNYKQFDFSFSGRVSLGNYVYNNGKSSYTYSGLFDATKYFANIRSSAAELGFSDPQYWSDIYIEDGSFFKMDNISLGYTLNDLFSKSIQCRIGLTVQNAFMITKYDGIDPEVASGIDNNIYPRPRTYLLGLNFNF